MVSAGGLVQMNSAAGNIVGNTPETYSNLLFLSPMLHSQTRYHRTDGTNSLAVRTSIHTWSQSSPAYGFGEKQTKPACERIGCMIEKTIPIRHCVNADLSKKYPALLKQ